MLQRPRGYLRTYRRAVDASLVAEFLLLDRLFPRSVFRALTEAERCLSDLDPHPSRAGLEEEARRILGRARTDLCQDFAHLTLGVLRAMGIPGRYVSGYLHPFPDAGIGQAVTGQSHAWVEWWDGDWRPFDPTNGVFAGERHVIVGRGRDYHDVTPLKGVFKGGPAEGLGVEVELTRLG